MSAQEQDPAVPRFPPITDNRHWLELLIGVLAIAVGIAAVAWPSATIQVIAVLFGLNLLVTGLIRAGLLLFLPGYPLLYRLLGITFGVLTAIIGILCLRNITGSVKLLLLVIAIGWLLSGLIELFTTLGHPHQPGGGTHLATAILLILGALALLVWPQIGLGTFIFIGATILIFVGAGHLISAIGGIRADHHPTHPRTGPETTPAR